MGGKVGDQNSEIKVTREALFNILITEKNNRSLQKLSDTFLSDTVNYTKDKQQMLASANEKDDEFSTNEKDILRVQLDNIRHIIRSIYDYRERKIVNMAIDKSRASTMPVNTTTMLPEERDMFLQLVKIMKDSRRDLLHSVLTGKYESRIAAKPQETKAPPPEHGADKDESQAGDLASDSGSISITAIVDIPKFVSKDMKMYGPYGKDQTITIAKEIGELLIAKGRAKPA